MILVFWDFLNVGRSGDTAGLIPSTVSQRLVDEAMRMKLCDCLRITQCIAHDQPALIGVHANDKRPNTSFVNLIVIMSAQPSAFLGISKVL